jgi:hypothetical protein
METTAPLTLSGTMMDGTSADLSGAYTEYVCSSRLVGVKTTARHPVE